MKFTNVNLNLNLNYILMLTQSLIISELCNIYVTRRIFFNYIKFTNVILIKIYVCN